jgi:hypothetical protein
LCGVGALRLCYETAFWHTASKQVVAPNATFSVTGVTTGTAGCDDEGGDTLTKQLEGVIQASTINGRRTARILRSTKDNNGGSWTHFISASLSNNADTHF